MIHRLTLFRIVFLALFFSVAGAAPLPADVSFVHEFSSDELFLGTKQAELTVSYLPDAMYVDKETRFTGGWMKRFFGQVKTEHMATHFLMGRDQIREIDWQDRRIFVFDLDKMDKIQWIKERREAYEGISEHLKARYDIKAPRLSITVAPDAVTVSGYPCRHVIAHLRQETVDRYKKTSSITLVDQELWLSRQVPGFQAYQDFLTRLAARVGIDAHRLGPLTYLLRYWDGPLTGMDDTLNRLQGYPVKSKLKVTAQYVTALDSPSPRTLEKTLKEETVSLSAISRAPVDPARFAEPEAFEIIHPE